MMADQITKYIGVLSTKEIKVGSQERGQASAPVYARAGDGLPLPPERAKGI